MCHTPRQHFLLHPGWQELHLQVPRASKQLIGDAGAVAMLLPTSAVSQADLSSACHAGKLRMY
jgi:hypothetical protein